MMKKRILLPVAAAAVLLLTACGNSAPAAPEVTTDVNKGFTPAPFTVSTAAPAATSTPAPAKDSKEELANLPLDPAYDFDPDGMIPADFGAFFTEDYPCERSSYTLLAGDAYANEVTVIHGAEEGPVIYVVAGVHGNEEAAWQSGKLLEKISIRAGTLYVLAPANPWGAEKQPKSRYVDGVDLNRSFPGNAGGNAAQRVAYAIFSDIQEKQPDFVFDLHEAAIVEEDRDYLGSSLIFTDLNGFEELYFDLLWATEDGTICSRPFDTYAPGPNGSINNTVSTKLGIPIITVETFRGYAMENRISDQLDVVQYVLRAYGMV